MGGSGRGERTGCSAADTGQPATGEGNTCTHMHTHTDEHMRVYVGLYSLLMNVCGCVCVCVCVCRETSLSHVTHVTSSSTSCVSHAHGSVATATTRAARHTPAATTHPPAPAPRTARRVALALHMAHTSSCFRVARQDGLARHSLSALGAPRHALEAQA